MRLIRLLIRLLLQRWPTLTDVEFSHAWIMGGLTDELGMQGAISR